jgi:pimeloyl-ACP methyl ester carboxylesterase
MPEIQQLLLELPAGVEKIEIELSTHSLIALSTTKPAINPELVLCLPGFTGSKEDYVAILPPLSHAGYHVISIDQRGQFESKFTTDKNSFTIAALAQDVTALAKKFNKPLHVIGHSMGGLVAAEAVLREPELFSSVTLLCSGPGAIPMDRQRNITAIRKGFPQTPLLAAWNLIEAEEKRLDPDKFSNEVWAFRKKRWLENNPQALHEMAAILQDTPDFSEPLAKVLKLNQISSLVLTGENDDIWPLSDQQKMAQTLAADFVVLASAGHSPARETPAETAAALVNFYENLAEKVI